MSSDQRVPQMSCNTFTPEKFTSWLGSHSSRWINLLMATRNSKANHLGMVSDFLSKSMRFETKSPQPQNWWIPDFWSINSINGYYNQPMNQKFPASFPSFPPVILNRNKSLESAPVPLSVCCSNVTNCLRQKRLPRNLRGDITRIGGKSCSILICKVSVSQKS